MSYEELLQKVTKMYQKTIEDIANMTGLSESEVDEFINKTIDDFFNGNLDVNNLTNKVKEEYDKG